MSNMQPSKTGIPLSSEAKTQLRRERLRRSKSMLVKSSPFEGNSFFFQNGKNLLDYNKGLEGWRNFLTKAVGYAYTQPPISSKQTHLKVPKETIEPQSAGREEIVPSGKEEQRHRGKEPSKMSSKPEQRHVTGQEILQQPGSSTPTPKTVQTPVSAPKPIAQEVKPMEPVMAETLKKSPFEEKQSLYVPGVVRKKERKQGKDIDLSKNIVLDTGEELGIADVFGKYGRYLKNVLLKKYSNEEIVDDTIQETFQKLMGYWHKYTEPTWEGKVPTEKDLIARLVRMAINKLRDIQRKQVGYKAVTEKKGYEQLILEYQKELREATGPERERIQKEIERLQRKQAAIKKPEQQIVAREGEYDVFENLDEEGNLLEAPDRWKFEVPQEAEEVGEEVKSKVNDILASMPEDWRRVLLLKLELQGKDLSGEKSNIKNKGKGINKQIQEILGMTESQVKQRLFKAKNWVTMNPEAAKLFNEYKVML